MPLKLEPKQLFNDNTISKLKLAFEVKRKQIRNTNVLLSEMRKNLKLLREGRKNKNKLLDMLYYPSADSKTLVKM